jgi:hypothetical protein
VPRVPQISSNPDSDESAFTDRTDDEKSKLCDDDGIFSTDDSTSMVTELTNRDEGAGGKSVKEVCMSYSDEMEGSPRSRMAVCVNLIVLPSGISTSMGWIATRLSVYYGALPRRK